MKRKENKIIFKIDQEYKKMFMIIIEKTLKNNGSVPVDWQDIYYPFLALTPKLLKQYAKEKNNNVKLHTYLGIKCKNYARNACRDYGTHKFKVLNKSINDERILNKMAVQPPSVLEDSHDELLNDIKRSELTEMQEKVYELYFVQNYDFKRSAKELKISEYKIKKIIEDLINLIAKKSAKI